MRVVAVHGNSNDLGFKSVEEPVSTLLVVAEDWSLFILDL